MLKFIILLFISTQITFACLTKYGEHKTFGIFIWISLAIIFLYSVKKYRDEKRIWIFETIPAIVILSTILLTVAYGVFHDIGLDQYL